MQIRNRSTGEVVSVAQLKNMNPAVSFPRVVTANVLDGFGYDPVLPGPAASVSGPYETSVLDGVEQIDGQWYSKHIVGPIFQNNEEQAAYRANIDSEAATKVRNMRDSLLAKSDWTVLADSPLTTAKKTTWKTYRTALRNISAAEGFPHTMEWPTEPS